MGVVALHCLDQRNLSLSLSDWHFQHFCIGHRIYEGLGLQDELL